MGLVEILHKGQTGITLDGIPFSDVFPRRGSYDFSRLHETKGTIAEMFVSNWLNNCSSNYPGFRFETVFPENDTFHLERVENGVMVYNRDLSRFGGKSRLHEYDDVIVYDGKPYAVEVKGDMLNPAQSYVERSEKKRLDAKKNDILDLRFIEHLLKGHRIMRELYGSDNIGVLFFFPYFKDDVRDNAEAAGLIEAFFLKGDFKEYFQKILQWNGVSYSERDVPKVECVNLGYGKKQLTNYLREFYREKYTQEKDASLKKIYRDVFDELNSHENRNKAYRNDDGNGGRNNGNVRGNNSGNGSRKRYVAEKPYHPNRNR